MVEGCIGGMCFKILLSERLKALKSKSVVKLVLERDVTCIKRYCPYEWNPFKWKYLVGECQSLECGNVAQLLVVLETKCTKTCLAIWVICLWMAECCQRYLENMLYKNMDVHTNNALEFGIECCERCLEKPVWSQGCKYEWQILEWHNLVRCLRITCFGMKKRQSEFFPERWCPYWWQAFKCQHGPIPCCPYKRQDLEWQYVDNGVLKIFLTKNMVLQNSDKLWNDRMQKCRGDESYKVMFLRMESLGS